MSTSINKELIIMYNAHSGDSFKINRHYFVSLDEIKKFCSKQFNIPIQQIFLISPFGMKLKITFLEQLDEVYVFDRNLFSVYNDDQSIRRYIRNKYSIDSFKMNFVLPIHSPLEDIDLTIVTQSRNSRQLMGLLTTNLGWVSAIQSDTKLFVKRSKEVSAKSLIILKALKVACQYIESYCNDIKKQFDVSVDLIINIQKHSLNLSWNDHWKNLETIYDINQTPLSDLLNKKELNDVAHESIRLNESINSSFISHKSQLKSSKNFREGVDTDLNLLEKEIIVHLNTLQLDNKLNNMNTVCDKLRSETKSLLSQSSTIDDISIDLILDLFTSQKSNSVTQIYQQSNDLYISLKKLIDIFNKVQLQTSTFLQRLSQAQADMVTLKESLKEFSIKTESIQALESKLCLTIDLPLLYGLYITECFRRDEWSKRIKKLAGSTNENFANFKEKEIKLRSIWIKNYSEILSLLDVDSTVFIKNGMLSFDLNVMEEVNNSSPDAGSKNIISYDEVVRYVEQLHSNGINPDIINLLTKHVNEIPVKMAKIKLHDPINPDSSTVLSPVDKETITGLKTRIKKLENLLHQKSFQPNVMIGPPESKFSAMAKRSIVNSTINGTENEIPVRSSSPIAPNVETTQILKLQDENMHLTTDLKNERGKLDTITDELISLKQTLSIKEFDIQTLQKRLENLQDEKSSDISKLQLELTMEQACRGNLESELERKTTELESIMQKHQDEKILLEKVSREEIENWRGKFERQEKDLSQREKEYQYCENSAKNQLEGVNEQLDLLKNEKKVVDGRLSKCNDENKKINETLKTLKRENKNLKEEVLKSSKESQSMKENISTQLVDYEVKIKKLKAELEDSLAQNTKLKTELRTKDNKLDEFEELLSEKNKIITQQSEEVSSLSAENKELKLIVTTHETKLVESNEDYEKLLGMKNDLLENMSNRETEFAKEKTSHHEEVDLLKSRIEELEQAQLAEVKRDDDDTQKTNTIRNEESERQANTIFQLVIIINSLIIKSRDLSEILFQFYEILCSSLKSLGLLAVKNEIGEVKIIRYKGLKRIVDESTLELPNGLSSGLIADVEKHLLWTELPNTTELTSDLNQEATLSSNNLLANSESLDPIVDTLIKNYNLTSFEDKYIDFVKSVDNLTPLYQSHIAKRFAEVESLAKKELKDKRKLKLELQQKITIRDFKKGDLVLFLPTGNNDSSSVPEKKTISWAAFNNMKDVKFLKKFDEKWDTIDNNKNKKWFIGKVLDIEAVNPELGEFIINSQEYEF